MTGRLRVCDASTKLPADTVAFQKATRRRDLSGVVVTCTNSPHDGREDHRGPVHFNGQRIGVYTWAVSPPP